MLPTLRAGYDISSLWHVCGHLLVYVAVRSQSFVVVVVVEAGPCANLML